MKNHFRKVFFFRNIFRISKKVFGIISISRSPNAGISKYYPTNNIEIFMLKRVLYLLKKYNHYIVSFNDFNQSSFVSTKICFDSKKIVIQTLNSFFM